MFKTVAAVIGAVTSAVMPAQAPKHIDKPPLADITVVKIMPHVTPADGNYVIEGSAEDRYAELKAKLDERFKRMFELKEQLEREQSSVNAKWEEYHALNERYNRELKKIIAAWVTESNY